MVHTAKGKSALRTRRERALGRRREELRKWIENSYTEFDFNDRPAKIDRAIQDVEHLERRLGVK